MFLFAWIGNGTWMTESINGEAEINMDREMDKLSYMEMILSCLKQEIERKYKNSKKPGNF